MAWKLRRYKCSKCGVKGEGGPGVPPAGWKAFVLVVRAPGEAQSQQFFELCASCVEDLRLADKVAADVMRRLTDAFLAEGITPKGC